MASNDTKPARGVKAAAEINSGAASSAAEKSEKYAADVASAAFSYPKFEVPEVIRSFAEQGLTQSREAYGRVKAAAEEATDVLEESFETTRASLRDVQFKALDAAKANADASFDFARQFLTATSFADAVQLQTSFLRERFDALAEYSKDVQGAMTKVGAEATKPAKVLFDRAMSQTKSAA